MDRRGVPRGSGSVREGNSASASAPAVTRETRAGARYRGHTESWQTGHPDARAYTITEHSADSLTLTHTHTKWCQAESGKACGEDASVLQKVTDVLQDELALYKKGRTC